MCSYGAPAPSCIAGFMTVAASYKTSLSALPETWCLPCAWKFMVCFLSDTRRIISLLCTHRAKIQHTAKICFVVCFFLAHGQSINTLPCIFFWHTTKDDFAMRFILTHGKVIKKIYLFISKLFLLFIYNMWCSILKFDVFLYLFVICN